MPLAVVEEATANLDAARSGASAALGRRGAADVPCRDQPARRLGAQAILHHHDLVLDVQAWVRSLRRAWNLFPPGRYEFELQRLAHQRKPVHSVNDLCVLSRCDERPYPGRSRHRAVRDGARRSHRWRNMWWRHWTIRLPQAVLVLFASWAVATIFLVGFDPSGRSEFRRAERENEQWSVLRASFAYNAPATLRGSMLALFVVLLLDAFTAETSIQAAKADVEVERRLGILGCGRNGSGWRANPLGDRLGVGAQRRRCRRRCWTPIDRGLIAYMAIYSALLVRFVVFFVSLEALYNMGRAGRTP